MELLYYTYISINFIIKVIVTIDEIQAFYFGGAPLSGMS